MLDSRQFRYIRKGPIPYWYDHVEQTCPRGLLQGGAASSSLLALALDDLPDHLPSEVHSIVQSDNIIIVCRSREECEAAAETLGRYLRDNPAGTFSPRIETYWLRHDLRDSSDPDALSWEAEFEQFGYLFRIGQNGQCETNLSMPNLIKTMARISEYLGALNSNQYPILSCADELKERLAGFPALTANGVDVVSQLIEPEFTQKIIEADRLARIPSTTDDGHLPFDIES